MRICSRRVRSCSVRPLEGDDVLTLPGRESVNDIPQHGVERRLATHVTGLVAVARGFSPVGGDGATVQRRTAHHDDAAWRDSWGIPERDP